jgi:TonB family protein
MKNKYLILFCLLLFSGTIIAQEKPDSAYNLVEQMPSFRGDLSTYLRNHLHYPQAAFDNNIEGTTYLSFIVTKAGEIKDVKIEKGVSPDLDSVAVTVLKNMPKWNPGMQNGKEVNVYCHLPVKFTIDKTGNAPKAPHIKRNFCKLKGFYLVPYAGVGGGGISLNNGGLQTPPNSFPSNNAKYPVTFTGGSEFGYMFNNHCGIFVSAQYQKYSTNYSLGNIVSQSQLALPIRPNPSSPYDTIVSYYFPNINYSFAYIQTPIVFRYINAKPGKVGLDLEAGVIFGYLLSASESGNIYQESYSYINYSYIWSYNSMTSSGNAIINSNVGNTNKIDLGLALSIGLNIPLSNIFSLSLGFISAYKFNSVGNGEKDIANFGNGTTLNYYQGQYGKANSIIFNPKLIIRLGKPDSPTNKDTL